MLTFVYRDTKGGIHRLTATQWGLGQIMAMVMLTSQLWDVRGYLLEPSIQDETKTRFGYCIQQMKSRIQRKYESMLAYDTADI